MAAINFTNTPTSLSMTDFMSIAANKDGSFAKQSRFAVKISSVGLTNTAISALLNQDNGNFINELVYLCEAAEFPGRSMELMENRYYGPAFNLPRNTKYAGTIDLSFLCRSEAKERQFFDDWLNIINPVNNFHFEYRNNYMSQIDVFQFADYAASAGAKNPKPVYQWTLHEAWPIQISEQQVTWADDNILRLSVTFTYKYWTRPGRDNIA